MGKIDFDVAVIGAGIVGLASAYKIIKHHPELSVAVLEKEPNIILAYPKTKIIDENDNEISEYDDGIHLKSLSASGRFLQFMYSVGECNAVFGLLRSDSLKKTRLIGNYIGADVCLLAELSLLGRFYEIPDYLFFQFSIN